MKHILLAFLLSALSLYAAEPPAKIPAAELPSFRAYDYDSKSPQSSTFQLLVGKKTIFVEMGHAVTDTPYTITGFDAGAEKLTLTNMKTKETVVLTIRKPKPPAIPPEK